MAKYSDAIRDAIIADFNAGDQPTEAQFTNWITRIQEGIEEHQHDGTGNGDGLAALGPLTSLTMADDAWIGIGVALERIVFDAAGDISVMGADFGIGTLTPKAHLDVTDITLDTIADFYGIDSYHIKTAGVTDENDDMTGLRSFIRLDQVGGILGSMYGAYAQAFLLEGVVGANGTPKNMVGLTGVATVSTGPAVVWGDVMGSSQAADLNVGTFDRDVFGLNVVVDIEAAVTSIGGDVVGLRVWIDADTDPVGEVYMILLDENTGVDFGIFQDGTAPNQLGGILGIGTAPIAGSLLTLNTPTEDTEFIDAGSAGATQQDWIKVEVGGNIGYIHVYAAV